MISALSLAASPTDAARELRTVVDTALAGAQTHMTPIAVTIAGSDSGGGAGIQADLKTFSALGVYGASVITALTAQNTKGVTGIHDVPADFITAQIDAVFSDLDVSAVKIGMLSQPAVIEAVAAGLDRWKARNVVLDPVMVATSGDRLLNPEAIGVLKRVLIPRALVITPNLPEAAALLDGAACARRGRDAPAGRGADVAWRARGAHQGRPRQRRRKRRRLAGADLVHAARHRPRCDQEHPWYRLHALIGHRRRLGQGPRSDRGCARRKSLCQRGDCGLAAAQDRLRPRAGAPFPRVVVNPLQSFD